ncbi:sphinganine kinase lcb4 [Cryptotrichosporon argae]
MLSRPQDIPVILHNDKRGLLTVEDDQLDVLQLSSDGRPPKRLLSCPTKHVLRARLAANTTSTPHEPRRLDLAALIRRGGGSGGGELRLAQIRVLVEPINAPEAAEWVATLMGAAYGEIKPFRKVLLIINPVGGKGKAKALVHDTVLPILEAAGAHVDVKETTHRLHAQEIAESVDLVYDVVAVAGGDGTTYEVLNGFARRPDARRALVTPLAPIPTGSACAVAINLFGVKDTFNLALAALNVLKGSPLTIDLCSVLVHPPPDSATHTPNPPSSAPPSSASARAAPEPVRRVSFLSQAVGLMVDLDIGTENLRWIGDGRFLYGFVRGLVRNREVHARVRMRVHETDKVSMARLAREDARARRGGIEVGPGRDPSSTPASGSASGSGSGSRGLQRATSMRKSKSEVGIARGLSRMSLSLGAGRKSLSGSSTPRAARGSLADGSGTTSPAVLEAAALGTSAAAPSPDGGPAAAAAADDTAKAVEIASDPAEPFGWPEPAEPDETWVTIESGQPAAGPKALAGGWVDGEGILYVYAGAMPYAARDLMQWPVARPAAGTIDVVVQAVVGRGTLVGAITGAEKGEAYWMDCQHYYKVSSYVVDNLDPAAHPTCTIDGEAFPYARFQVDVLPRAARVMCLAPDFDYHEFLAKPERKR